MKILLSNLLPLASQLLDCEVLPDAGQGGEFDYPWLLRGTCGGKSWQLNLTDGCLEALLSNAIPRWNSMLVPSAASCSMALDCIGRRSGIDASKIKILSVYFANPDHRVLDDRSISAGSAWRIRINLGARVFGAMLSVAEEEFELSARPEITGGCRVTVRYVLSAKLKIASGALPAAGSRHKLENLELRRC